MALRLGLLPDLPFSREQFSHDGRSCQFGEVLRSDRFQTGSPIE